MEGDGTERPRDGSSPPREGESAEAAREARRRELAERLEEIEAERGRAADEGDQTAEANALRRMGDLQRAAGVDDAARESYGKARQLHQQAGNADGAAAISMTLGNMEIRLRRFEPAARLFHEAREYYQRVPDPAKEADALLSEADALYALGKLATAVQRIDAANALFAGLDDTLGQAHAAFRMGVMAAAEDPQMADEHLELASRLFADHVGRDTGDVDVPLPATVPDSRHHPPYVMQRVCMRERQRLAGGGAVRPLTHRGTSGSSARKARRATPQAAGAEKQGMSTWIGIAVLVVLAAAFLLPHLLADTSLFALLADLLGDSVTVGTVMHLAVGAFGAVVAVVAAQQMGISAPVVLLAMAIGFGAIFHEISRAVFPGLDGLATGSKAAAPSAAAQAELQRLQEERARSAKLVVDARAALARGDVAAARSLLNDSLAAARSANDTAGRLRALEEMMAVEAAHGEIAERLAVAETLYEAIPAADAARRRALLEEIIDLAASIREQGKLRDAQVKLLQLHERDGDTEAAVAILVALAALDRDAHHLESAYDWFNRAHGAYQSLRDSEGQLSTLQAMGEIDARLGRRRRAYGHYYHAFVMYRELDDKAGQAAMLLHMGNLDELDDKHEEAINAFRQSQRLYNAAADEAGEALAALRFGAAQLAYGSQRQARDGFRRSLELYSLLGERLGQARANLGLGQYWAKAGKPLPASEHFAAARALYREAGDRRGELAALREIILLAHAGGGIAQGDLAQMRRIARGIADPGVRAGVLLSSGDLALAVDRPVEAESIYREALAVFAELGDDAGQRVARERLTRLPPTPGPG